MYKRQNLGGAILLNSKQTNSESTYFRNNFTIGSYDLLKNNLQFSHTGNKLALNLHYGYMETDGYRENNKFKREGVLLDLKYLINPKTNLALLFNHVDYNAQIPSSLGETDFKENPTKAAFTWKAAKGYEDNKYSLVGLTINHAFSDKINNTTSIFYSYLDHYEPRPFGILEEYTNGYGFRTKFAGTWATNGPEIDYNFGAELYKDEYLSLIHI